MSEWYTIKDKDDVALSEDGATIEVLFTYNNFGNVYIEIPVEFVHAALKPEGSEN